MKKTILIAIAVIVLILIGTKAYQANKTGSEYVPSADEMANMNSEIPDDAALNDSENIIDVTADAEIGVSKEKQFTLTGSNFSFSPSTITVKKGDKVTIVFKNSGGLHDFKIDEFQVASKKIGSGETDTVTFTADKAGSFEYYCSVGNHRAMGMKGTLIVE